jgi:predicted dehydrogenase
VVTIEQRRRRSGPAGSQVGIGVVGIGYWGPKHIRAFSELPQARVAMVADVNPARLATTQAQYRGVRTTTRFDDMLAAPAVQGIVVATPASTHARLVRAALLAGKHVLVEKPLALSTADASDLVGTARAAGRTLMVGHTFLYNPAVRALRELVQDGELGEIYYAHSQRLNLGLFQRDINVIWDLAPHDVSILMYVLGTHPVAVSARGSAYVQQGIEDVAYLEVAFPERVRTEIHVSWLDPNKVRRTTIVGSRKMAVYDDLETLEKIRVYNKGVHAPPRTDTFGEFQLSYRYGEITIPHLASTEPLRLECEHFLECIQRGVTPLTDGENGLEVVQVLETAQRSLSNGARLLPVQPITATHGATHSKPLNGPPGALPATTLQPARPHARDIPDRLRHRI